MSTQAFDFAGPVGRLEAILMRPETEPVAAAVVCHAHPLRGGMMHFRVVFRAAKALQQQGVAVLRFNFRGVGRSEGVHDHGQGERDDVRSALDEVRRRCPGLPLVLGGFSFGSMIALAVGAGDPQVKGLFALGLPLSFGIDLSPLSSLRTPRLFVQGEQDQFGSGERLAELVAPLPEPKQLVVVPQSDHFFTGHLDELQTALGSWAADRPWSAVGRFR